MGQPEDEGKIFQLVPQQASLPVEFDDPVGVVFEFWKAMMGHPRSRLGPPRRTAIKKALMIGYSVDDLRLACVGCRFSDWHQGDNRDGAVYDDIELICRSEAKIDRFMQIGEARVKAMIAKDQQTAQDAQNPAVPMPADVRAKLDALFKRATEARRS